MHIQILKISDSLQTWVSAGTISSEESNERDVGIGSQDLGAIFFKRAETAVSFTALTWAVGSQEKKFINHTRGNADAVVNILSYDAYFMTKLMSRYR